MALGMGAVRYITGIKLPVALPLALSVMFFGILWMRYIFKENNTSLKEALIPLTVFAILLIPTSLLAYNKDYGFGETWYRYVLTYFAALAIFLFFTTRYRITNKVIVFLGKISYSIYLTHSIVEQMIIHKLYFSSILTSPYERLFVSLGLTLILSIICYYFIEKPFVNIGRKVIQRFTNKDRTVGRIKTSA